MAKDCSECAREQKTVYHAIDFASTFGLSTQVASIFLAIIIYKMFILPVVMTVVYTIVKPLGSDHVWTALAPIGNMLLQILFGVTPHQTGIQATEGVPTTLCGAIAKGTCGYWGCLVDFKTADKGCDWKK
jgi:hypothetical protein